MQADYNGTPDDPIGPGRDSGDIRPVLRKAPALTTIVIAGPGHLFVRRQEDAIDKYGFIEFAMASKYFNFVYVFKVLPGSDTDEDDLVALAEQAGNHMLVYAFAESILKERKWRKRDP